MLIPSSLRVSRAALVTMICLCVAVAGCGSQDVGVDPAPSVPAAPPVPATPPAPGTVTLDLSEVTGATGLVMLSFIGTNLPRQPFGAVCEIVGTDGFSFTGQYLPITGDDPCTLGTEPVEFAPGSYDVIVAALPGGSTTPHQCTQTQVTVDGDVTVEVTSLGTPGNCDF